MASFCVSPPHSPRPNSAHGNRARTSHSHVMAILCCVAKKSLRGTGQHHRVFPNTARYFEKPEVDPVEIKNKRPEVPQRNIFSSSLKNYIWKGKDPWLRLKHLRGYGTAGYSRARGVHNFSKTMDSEVTLILYYLRKLYFDCTCWAVKVGTWRTVMLAALVMLTQAVFLTISSTVYINRSI
jgi:hypothetical protein